MKHDMAWAPGDLLNGRAWGAVVEAWVASERRSPRKSTSASRLRRVGRVIGSGSAVDWSEEDVTGTPVPFGHRLVPGLEAPHRRPGLHQGASDGEVII
jgi:hypothetical protein